MSGEGAFMMGVSQRKAVAKKWLTSDWLDKEVHQHRADLTLTIQLHGSATPTPHRIVKMWRTRLQTTPDSTSSTSHLFRPKSNSNDPSEVKDDIAYARRCTLSKVADVLKDSRQPCDTLPTSRDMQESVCDLDFRQDNGIISQTHRHPIFDLSFFV